MTNDDTENGCAEQDQSDEPVFSVIWTFGCIDSEKDQSADD